MPLRPAFVLLSVLAVAASLLGASACRKNASRDATDGAPGGGDASADGASATLDDAAAAVTATTAVAAAPAAATTAVAPIEPPPTPFTGTYRCFNGMRLEQAGRIVTSTMHKGTTDTVVACTVAGDECTGTVREIQTTRGKAPKVMHVKPVTLQRTPSGDIVYRVGSSETKHGAHDQTFCPRR